MQRLQSEIIEEVYPYKRYAKVRLPKKSMISVSFRDMNADQSVLEVSITALLAKPYVSLTGFGCGSSSLTPPRKRRRRRCDEYGHGHRYPRSNDIYIVGFYSGPRQRFVGRGAGDFTEQRRYQSFEWAETPAAVRYTCGRIHRIYPKSLEQAHPSHTSTIATRNSRFGTRTR